MVFQREPQPYYAGERRTIKWSFTKLLITSALFLGSFGVIYLCLQPLIDGDYELKSFVSAAFSVVPIFLLFAVAGIKRNTHWFFWVLVLFMTDAMIISIIMYESIFL